MDIVLSQNKETKGAIRFADEDNHNLYLRKEEVVALGSPKHLLITIQPMRKS